MPGAIPYGDLRILVNQSSFVNEDGYYYALLRFHCAVYTKTDTAFAKPFRDEQERPLKKPRHPLDLVFPSKFRYDLESLSRRLQPTQVVARRASQPTTQACTTIDQSNPDSR